MVTAPSYVVCITYVYYNVIWARRLMSSYFYCSVGNSISFSLVNWSFSISLPEKRAIAEMSNTIFLIPFFLILYTNIIAGFADYKLIIFTVINLNV